MIYLDNASTTKVSNACKEVLDKYLYESFGNAGSIHALGQEAKKAIDIARERVAALVGTDPENVIFTSSGSEANSLAILGVANHLKAKNKTHILTSKYEHKSVLNAMKKMEELGFAVEYLNIDPYGYVDPAEFHEAIRPNTGLASIMYVNNELGTHNNIDILAWMCQRADIIFHSDCVQAAGARQIRMDVRCIDMVSVSGHKIHAPKGIGCLCVKDKSILESIIYGGEQEYGLRGGTENVALISAFGIAAQEAATQLVGDAYKKIMLLRSSFVDELLSRRTITPKIKFTIPSDIAVQMNKVCSFRIEGVDANTLVLMLSNEGIYVSAGSACNSHSSEPSHVLKAVGLSDVEARSTIRVSFSGDESVEDVKYAASKIIDCAEQILKYQR